MTPYLVGAAIASAVWLLLLVLALQGSGKRITRLRLALQEEIDRLYRERCQMQGELTRLRHRRTFGFEDLIAHETRRLVPEDEAS